MRDENEEARMELTFLSSDGRSRQGNVCSLLRREPLYWFMVFS